MPRSKRILESARLKYKVINKNKVSVHRHTCEKTIEMAMAIRLNPMSFSVTAQLFKINPLAAFRKSKNPSPPW